MKYFMTIMLAALVSVFAASGQTTPMDEANRLPVGVEQPKGVKYESSAQTLKNNLTQALVLNGLAAAESRFTTIVSVVETGKDVTGTAPVMIVTELEVSMFIIDLYSGNIFGQTAITLKGVGDKEAASYMDALRNLKARNPKLRTFIVGAKNKIIAYFDAESEQILKRLDALISSGNYREAAIEAAAVPRAASVLYNKVSERIALVPASYVQAPETDRSLVDGYFYTGSREERIKEILK